MHSGGAGGSVVPSGDSAAARSAAPTRAERLHMKPQTVLFAAWAPFFSGAERALLVTIFGLDRERYRPYAVVGTDGELVRQLRDAGVPVSVVPFCHRDRRHPAAFIKSV